MTKSVKSRKENEYIIQLLKDRYFLKKETSWEQLAKRVSGIYSPIFEYIRDKIFIPSTPTLLNANTGGERTGSLSSCFPMGIEDSIMGIFEAIKEAALVTQASGGVGYDFSSLRSSNEVVRGNNRKSSGPLPFIKVFSSMLESIQQGGVRRGAGGALLDIGHPDIIKFIKCKENVKDKSLEMINNSVKVDDDFYTQLEKNPDASHKVMEKSGRCYDLQDENGNIVSVKQLWGMIVHYAWRNGEPGIFNSTIAFNRCVNTNLSKIVVPNPCQPSWAKVITPDGIREMGEIKEGDLIWSVEGWTKVVRKWSNGIKKVLKYSTTAGIFYGTEDHRVVSNGVKIPAKIAESIDIIDGGLETDNIRINSQDVVDGLVIGDGTVHKSSNNLVLLNIGKNDIDYFDSEIKNYIKERSFAGDCTYRIQTTISFLELPRTFDRRVPVRFIKDKNKLVGFLRGLYSANGSICGGRVTLKATSLEMIEDVQLMLNSIGIKSYYTINNPTKIKFENGEYLCKKSYDLNITVGIIKFKKIIGFIQKYKNDKLNDIINKRKVFREGKLGAYVIKSVESISEEEVFDITVDNNSHTYWSQGCNISNCREYVNIPYSSCNLGSINLTAMVGDDGKFDWCLYRKVIEEATYFMNNVIDVNDYPLEKIREVTQTIRSIGIGVMGLGDLFYMLKIPYNSEQAVNLTRDIVAYETLVSMEVSSKLAKKYGKTYGNYDYNLFMKVNEKFFDRPCQDIDLNALKKSIKDYGVYNSSFTSIAPNGSIGTIAGVSNGIEPVFQLNHLRKVENLGRKEGGRYDIMHITDTVFEQYLDDNFPEKKEKILNEVADNNGSCQNCMDIPKEDRDYFLTASDLIPEDHLPVLGVVANNISLSVSKTVNMPKNAKEKDVSDIYLKAHKMGIIGLTVYRDGSREGILVSRKDQKEGVGIVKTNAPKRPVELPCDIHHVKISKKLDKVRHFEYIVAVGLLFGEPYEIFVFENGKLDKKYTQGLLVKRERGKYDIKFEDGVVQDNIMQDQTSEEECVTRLASSALRHGTDIAFIVHQLEKVKGDSIGTFTKVISRTLKKYIIEGSKVYGESCPVCLKKKQEPDLVRQGGCVHCRRCGWDKC